MKYRQLGSSDLKASVVGFGCWQMGGRFWAFPDEQKMVDAARRAVDLGVSFFDTADIYGNGRSEQLLGEAIRGVREKVLIATKFGNCQDPSTGERWNDASAKYVREAVELSLRNLGTDYVDLYQMHTPDRKTPAAETIDALRKLQKEGKIRAFGVSNVNAEQLAEYIAAGPVHTLQCHFNMLVRDNQRQLFGLCKQHKVGVIPFSPLQLGLLTGKFNGTETFPEEDLRSHNAYFKPGAFRKNVAVVEKLKAIARRKGCNMAQLAIAWVLSQEPVATAIPGIKRYEQIADLAPAADVQLTAEDLGEIDAILADTEAGEA